MFESGAIEDVSRFPDGDGMLSGGGGGAVIGSKFPESLLRPTRSQRGRREECNRSSPPFVGCGTGAGAGGDDAEPFFEAGMMAAETG